jgi:hypothetical protein
MQVHGLQDVIFVTWLGGRATAAATRWAPL